MNPYCGYQDPYGCGIGGFKRIDFERGGIVRYDFLPTDIFRKYDMHLVFTGVTRNSKNVLRKVTDNIHKAKPLLKTADRAYKALIREDHDEFLDLMNKSWQQKKETTSVVTENQVIKDMDTELENNESVRAHRLCGAGNGGFFLTFSEKDTLNIPYESVKINVTPSGVSGIIV